MGHHHHEDESHVPKLPKVAGQVLFVLVVGAMLWASVFLYQKLIPIGAYVSELDQIKQLVKVCKKDVEANDWTKEDLEVWTQQYCSCVSEQIVSEKAERVKSWLKESTVAERTAMYKVKLEECQNHSEK